jgi:hypothetical protein
MDSAQTKLKIKIKSLAQEARIIRREERRALRTGRWAKAHEELDDQKSHYALYESLHGHRTMDLRGEARASLIAYAFMRGKPLIDTWDKTRPRPPYHQAALIVKRFDPASFENFNSYIKASITPAKEEEPING